MLLDIFYFFFPFLLGHDITKHEVCLESALMFQRVSCTPEPLIYEDNFGSMFWVKRFDTKGNQENLMLRVQDISDPANKMAVDRELDLLTKVDHPNVQRLVDSKIFLDKAHFLLEWPSLGDLRLTLKSKRERRLEGNKQIFTAFLQIVRGVSYLHHNLGVVHGNLTDSNILMADQHRPLIANLRASVDKNSKSSYRGVPGWMDPIFYGAEAGVHQFDFTEQVDVYSLGVILYQMFHEGQLPYGRDWEYRKKVDIGSYQIRYAVPYEAVFAINRCLQVDPAKRLTLAELAVVIKYGRDRSSHQTTTQVIQESNREPSPEEILKYIQKKTGVWTGKISDSTKRVI